MTTHTSTYFFAALLMLFIAYAQLANAQSLNAQTKRQDSIVSINSISQTNLAQFYSDQVSGNIELSETFDLDFTAELTCQITTAKSGMNSHAVHGQLQVALENVQANPKVSSQNIPSIDLLEAMLLNMITRLSTYQNINQSCLINTFSTELISKANLQS